MTAAWLPRQALPGARRFAASKVPAITVYFWVIKILSTGMGETTSDFLVHRFNPYFAVALGAAGFALAMSLQLTARRYVTGIYWFAVVMVSVFGTMAADVTHIVLGVPYLLSTAAFSVALAIIVMAWQATEGTLSIHSIVTPRRELFYWATVVATFALGTAAGDMVARTLRLGFGGSGIVFAVVFAIPAISHARLGMNPVLAFWFAYIVTRPLGASFADWTAIPHSYGGLALGYGPVSAVLTVLIVIGVAYLAVTGKDTERPAAAAVRAGAAAAQAPPAARGGGRHRAPQHARHPQRVHGPADRHAAGRDTEGRFWQ